MKEFFHVDYKIDYMFLNGDLTAGFVNLAAKVQETSLLHSLHCGYSMDWFYENKCGFVLTGWNIEIMRYPKWGEKIRITTWPSKFKSMLACRTFIGHDEDGNMLFKADSDWIFMNLLGKKPLRITQQMHERYAPMAEAAMGEKIRIQEGEGFDILATVPHKVTRGDIDTNRHVNNISYIAWAMDAVPEEYYSAHEPIKVMVKYSKECYLGEELVVEVKFCGDEFLTYIRSKGDNELRCAIYSKWCEKRRVNYINRCEKGKNSGS